VSKTVSVWTSTIRALENSLDASFLGYVGQWRSDLESHRLAITPSHFFKDHEDTMRAESRAQLVAGVVTHAPWQCRVWNYAIRDGMRVPLDGEATWVTPEGVKPYWRGHITKLTYEIAQ
jgi:hypothetical protein